MISENNYFDHDADVGIIGRGASLEAAFADAALAMFALMADLSEVRQRDIVEFDFAEEDVELAFVTWLNLLITKAQTDNKVFSYFEIHRENNTWYGEARGEVWNDSIERGIEVKGATLTMLSVKRVDDIWEAKCVVDV